MAKQSKPLELKWIPLDKKAWVTKNQILAKKKWEAEQATLPGVDP